MQKHFAPNLAISLRSFVGRVWEYAIWMAKKTIAGYLTSFIRRLKYFTVILIHNERVQNDAVLVPIG